MKFTLEIELGNAAMLDIHDVEDALRSLVHERALPNDRHAIRDANGNTVGHWAITEQTGNTYTCKRDHVMRCDICEDNNKLEAK